MREKLKDVGYKQVRIKNRCNSFNFNSSCYLHCCCSNKQFFKFEAFPSTSVESLLALLAGALIYYYQIIVIRSMFSSSQVGLSFENTSFIHISSVSFSSIMCLTVQYMMFISISKFLKALHFDEHNVIKFLKPFEKQYNEYEVMGKRK